MTLLVLEAALPSPGEEKPSGEKEQAVAAEVNGSIIPAALFQQELRKALLSLGHTELSAQRVKEIRKEVLDRLIARELIIQAARKEQVEPETLRQREIDAKSGVSDDEVRNYIREHPDEFMTPEGVRYHHLLVRVDPSSTNEGWKAGYDKALELSDRARKGESFVTLIEKYSDPEARDFGGDLTIQFKGRMPMTEFELPAFSLKEKEVSLPIQTLYGFSLIQIVERIPPKPMTLSEINQELLKKRLKQEKESKRSEEWIGQLRSQAVIKNYLQ